MNLFYLEKYSKNKNIIINQFMGLGDILFIIPICYNFIDKGYNVILPVNKEFMNISENFDMIKIIDKNTLKIDYENNSIIETNNDVIIPLRFANNLLNNGDPRTCMSDKYKFVNLPLNLWKNLKWKRNINKENELYYNILNLKDYSEYTLVNNLYSMNFKINININDNSNNLINMRIIDGYNLLDWYKVIQNAKYIHTVGTAINYIMEVIPMKSKELHLYRRPMEKDFSFYLYLFDKKYILHI